MIVIFVHLTFTGVMIHGSYKFKPNYINDDLIFYADSQHLKVSLWSYGHWPLWLMLTDSFYLNNHKTLGGHGTLIHDKCEDCRKTQRSDAKRG